ncbi:MAG: hypothetical protein VX874_07650 [Pseudomonadota bacterium]|nr:hypothetical protein [Pseudomonadota bacterium]
MRGWVLPAVVLVLAVAGGAAELWLTGEGPVPEVDPYAAARDCPEAEQVRFEGKVFCPGTPVEVYKHAGIDTVEADGATYRVVVGAGRTGTILGHVPSPVNGTPSVARILWDPQDWPLEDGGTQRMPAFEQTTHADYLRVAQ